MNNLKTYFLLAVALLAVGSAGAQNWQISKTYTVEFSSSAASGIFKEVTGTIKFSEKDPASSSFDISLVVSSINTGNAMMNTHAKSADWLEAAKYPAIMFKSKQIKNAADGFLVTGDLSIHGVTKEISFPFSFKQSANSGTFSGSFTINRSDYKIGKAGGDVAEEFKINLSVPVTKI
jgi:polyisoprenoid-binding protein YceI